MFNVINDVPEAIKSFYVEDTRSEQQYDDEGNPIMTHEQYEYEDEEGNTQTGIREVPLFVDVTYVVELPRNDLKSWADVERVKLKGRIKVITHFINKACENDDWIFHDKYIAWFNLAPDMDDDKYSLLDEDNQPVYSYADDHGLWLEGEPTRIPSDPLYYIAAYNAENAKAVRDNKILSNIEVNGLVWQVADKDRNNINEALAYSGRQGLPDTETRGWILADNSVHMATLGELKEVMDTYTDRMSATYTSYSIWRAGDKQEPYDAG
jgi:hypothetical protein